MEARINVTKSSMPKYEEYIEEIKSIWDNQWLTNMGEKHNQLEYQLKQYLGVEYVSLMVNGHMSLELGLQAMELKGEVITTPFTFASTTHAIVRNGLEPVFCDISLDDYTMDVDKIESLITDRTCAILPVHVYGNVCNIEKIQYIANKYGLKVIYDAAHTFGEKYKGQGVCNYGDMSMLSFHATKVFHTIEGGAICYKNSDYQKKIFQLRDFGISDAENVDGVGANAKLNEFQAAMGLCNLRHIADEIKKRRKVVERYRELLHDVKGIYITKLNPDVEYNYAYFPILIDEKEFGFSRNEVFEWLKKENIYARKYFYPLTSSFACYNNKFDSSETPVALYVSKRILTLPLYADLCLDNVNKICEIIRNKGE